MENLSFPPPYGMLGHQRVRFSRCFSYRQVVRRKVPLSPFFFFPWGSSAKNRQSPPARIVMRRPFPPPPVPQSSVSIRRHKITSNPIFSSRGAVAFFPLVFERCPFPYQTGGIPWTKHLLPPFPLFPFSPPQHLAVHPDADVALQLQHLSPFFSPTSSLSRTPFYYRLHV